MTILTSAPTRQDCELNSRLGGHSDTYTCHTYGVGCVGIVTTPREHLDLGHTAVCALCGVRTLLFAMILYMILFVCAPHYCSSCCTYYVCGVGCAGIVTAVREELDLGLTGVCIGGVCVV